MIVLTFTEDQFRTMLDEAVSKALSNQEPANQQQYLTPVQLSELIGWKLSTVYQNHSHRLIPGAKKIGSRLLFQREVINSWIAENSIQTKAEKVKAIERRLNNGRK